MREIVVLIAVFLSPSTCVDNGFLALNYVTLPNLDETETTNDDNDMMIPNQKVMPLKNYDDHEPDEYAINNENHRHPKESTKKPCAIVVLSNIQNPIMQSLLRKYRYDANGVLIPSSVKYFIKLPQGVRSSPLLVPLNDKAFSPLGGFVRYYKEVPPIPHSW